MSSAAASNSLQPALYNHNLIYLRPNTESQRDYTRVIDNIYVSYCHYTFVGIILLSHHILRLEDSAVFLDILSGNLFHHYHQIYKNRNEGRRGRPLELIKSAKVYSSLKLIPAIWSISSIVISARELLKISHPFQRIPIHKALLLLDEYQLYLNILLFFLFLYLPIFNLKKP